MSWFKSGTWLDHPCKRPHPEKGYLGDRWKCKCGRIWEICNKGPLLATRYWNEVKDE